MTGVGTQALVAAALRAKVAEFEAEVARLKRELATKALPSMIDPQGGDAYGREAAGGEADAGPSAGSAGAVEVSGRVAVSGR